MKKCKIKVSWYNKYLIIKENIRNGKKNENDIIHDIDSTNSPVIVLRDILSVIVKLEMVT